jgi:hypothetical protein
MSPGGAVAIAAAGAFVLLLAACGGSGSGPGPAADAGPCARLAEAGKFRYTFSYTLDSPQPEPVATTTPVPPSDFALKPESPDFRLSQQMDGSVENPQRVDLSIKTPDSPDIRLIFIDGQEWVNLGGAWQQRQPDPVPFPAATVCSAVVSSLDLEKETSSPDTVGGVAAKLYASDSAEADIAARVWGADSDMGRLIGTYAVKIWIAEDGDPLRMEASGSGAYPGGREITVEISLELRDIGDSGIKVERPA